MIDIIRQLEADAGMRAQLRAVLLGDQFVDLPEQMAALTDRVGDIAEHMVSLTDRVEALAEQMITLTARVDALTERVDVLTARVDALTQRMDELTQRMDALTERVDMLTARVDALAQRMDELTQRMDALTERVDMLTARVDALAQRMDELTVRVDALAEAQLRTETMLREHMANTNARFDRLETDVAVLKGSDLERRIVENPARYISDLAERIAVVTPGALDDLVDLLGRRSPLSPEELRRLRRSDLVAEARRVGSTERITVVAEVSHTLHSDDVLRAARTAEIFTRRDRRALALAIGDDLGGPEVAAEAAARGVILVATEAT